MTISSNKTLYVWLKNDVGRPQEDNYVTHNIMNIDTNKPNYTASSFKVTDSNTRGFTLELEAQDVESGLAQITWSYKLKNTYRWSNNTTVIYHKMHASDAGSREKLKKTHTFDQVSSGIYEVQATIYDVAGNKTTTDTIDITVGKIDDIADIKKGNLTYSPTTWTNGNVSVTLPTAPNLETRYTTDGSTPTPSSNKFATSSPILMSENGTIHYIYTDGRNIGQCATKNITNIDKEPVKIKSELVGIDETTEGFTVSIQVEDELTSQYGNSGLAKIDWYYKSSTDTGAYNCVTETYREQYGIAQGETGLVTKTNTITGLEPGIYSVYVDVHDVAGNVTSTSDRPIQVEVKHIPEVNDASASYEPTYWTDEDVTVTLSTENGLATKYTDDGSVPTLDNPNLKDYSGPFAISENKTIYYIYTDGRNISKNVGTKNVTNIDKTPATISNFAQSDVTTNGFKLSANIQDGESGIGKVVFYYKHQNDSTFSSKEWSNPNGVALKVKPSTQAGPKNITVEESITGLRSGAYECYIQVFNTAGKGTTTQGTSMPPINLGTIEEVGNATYSPTTWTNNDVTVTLPTAPAGLKTVFTRDGSVPTKDSEEFTGPFTVSSNSTINYIYTDGTNINKAKSVNITNIDKTPASVISDLAEADKSSTSIKTTITVQDTDSGLGKIVWYYKTESETTWSTKEETYTNLNGTATGDRTSQTKEYEFTGLTPNTKYLFYAIVFDVAGNQVGSRSAGSALEIQTSSLVEFSPNGNTTWEKEHSTTVTILDTAVDAKYCWTNSTSQPAETQFTENQTFASGDTISKDGVTGTYYLWTLIETTDGTKSYCKSEGFNFDNEGPNITSFTATKSSETAITLSTTAQDTKSGTVKFEFYVDDEFKDDYTQIFEATTSEITKSVTITDLSMGSHTCKVIVYDLKNNTSTKTITGATKLYTWERWSATATYTYSYSVGSKAGSYNQSPSQPAGGYRAIFDSSNGTWSKGSQLYWCQMSGYSFCYTSSSKPYYYCYTGCWGSASFNKRYNYDYYNINVTSTPKYSKGSTKYSDVTSSSSSAYPSNGASGSYWYVYKGVE